MRARDSSVAAELSSGVHGDGATFEPLLLANEALEDYVAHDIKPQPTSAASEQDQAYRERLVTAVNP
jgi:hypothetical protein